MKIQNKKVVLIHGKKRSGKNYFAKFLQRELKSKGINSEIHSFQDNLKKILGVSLEMDFNELEDLKNDDTEIKIGSTSTTMRKIIQRFGTDQMQTAFGKDVWVKLFLNDLEKTNANVILVPDFRFKHENISEFTVKILGGLDDTHISENDLKDFNFKYTVDNTNRLDLSSDAKQIAKDIMNEL